MNDTLKTTLIGYFKEFQTALNTIEEGHTVEASASAYVSQAEFFALQAAANAFCTWARIRMLRDMVDTAEIEAARTGEEVSH